MRGRGMGTPVVTITPSGARVVVDSSVVAAGTGTALLQPISPGAYPDGTLLQSPDGNVYVIQGGQRYWIYGWDAVAQLGYNASEIISTPQAAVNAIPLAGKYQMESGSLVLTDPNGNPISVQAVAAPATTATVSTVTTPGATTIVSYDAYGNGLNAAGQIIQYAPTNPALAVAQPVATGITSTLSALPSWVYWVGGGLGLFLLLKRR
jgi:hypothetical protein